MRSDINHFARHNEWGEDNQADGRNGKTGLEFAKSQRAVENGENWL